ncbi:hypothetical protein [Tepidimicrobium xylanilyticum]|nr:hypothetical protein [Tepidimicrobium xylanilyticum]
MELATGQAGICGLPFFIPELNTNKNLLVVKNLKMVEDILSK